MGATATISLDETPVALDDRRKKKRYGYLAWLCLGSHYLYLERPGRQLLFWLTLGGLLLWWLRDLFRLPDMIAAHNRRAAQTLIARYEDSLRERLLHLERLNSAAAMVPEIARMETQADTHHLYLLPDPVVSVEASAPLRTGGRTLPTLVLTSALACAAALYAFNPPPLFPHADASFRAMRQVNVRQLPTTASPIRGVAAKETVLSGTVVEVSGGAARWLKVGRGSHSGGYVAVQNLETL